MPRSTFERLVTAGSILERVAYGVYHLAGAPLPDHLELRAARLQVAPATPARERNLEQGVVSHRSAAAMYGLGHLPAHTHEFTLPSRRQTRRTDVRLHQLALAAKECIQVRGLPVTRPSRVASDLLADREDPEGVAGVVADAIRPPTTTPPRSPIHSPRTRLDSVDDEATGSHCSDGYST